MMDTIAPETCWAYKKHNKIISCIYLVIYSSIITMMHGPANIKLVKEIQCNVKAEVILVIIRESKAIEILFRQNLSNILGKQEIKEL